MKKFMVTMLAVVFGVLATGCPHQATPGGAADAVSIPPPARTPVTLPEPNPAPTGYFLLKLNLLGDGAKALSDEQLARIGQRYLDMMAAKSGVPQKAVSNDELIAIGRTFVEEADQVCAYLYSPLARGKSEEKGGGGGLSFCATMQNGQAILDSREQDIYIPLGSYDLCVDIYFNGCILLFGKPEGDGLVQINGGENTAEVEFNFMSDYWVGVTLGNLPMAFAKGGSVKLISAFYPQSTSYFLNGDGTMGFSFNGPVQFTGGTVIFIDPAGEAYVDPATQKPYAFDLQIDMGRDYGRGIIVDYVPSPSIATLEINSTFAFLTHILVNGQVVDNSWDLPNALFYAGQNVEMLIPGGDFYLGNVWLPPNVATIKILGRDVLTSRVHGRFTWDRFGTQKGGGSIPTVVDTTPVNTLTIDSITIIDETFVEYDDYSNATVFAQGVDGVTLTNCMFVANSRAISLNYVAVATIEHCDFLGNEPFTGAAIEASNCGPSPVSLKNSIIVHFPMVVSYNNLGTYAGFYNCIWDIETSYTNQGDAIPSSFIVANPMWENIAEHNFMLKPGSPCILTGDDGADRGVTFKGK